MPQIASPLTVTPKPSPPPPLWTWLAVLALVALCFGSGYIAVRSGLIRDKGNIADEWRRYRPNTPLVIGVGSSLLRASRDWSAPDTDPTFQFRAFYHAGANYGNFPAFFSMPVPDQPVLWLVHTDMFLRDEDVSMAFLAALRTGLGTALRVALGQPPPVFGDSPFCNADAPKIPRAERDDLVFAYQKNPDDNLGLLAWIAERRAAGQAVALLDIPRSPATEFQLQSSLTHWRQALDALGLPVLRYTGPLDESDFCDGAHMSPRGSPIYSRWLQQNIRRLLHEPR